MSPNSRPKIKCLAAFIHFGLLSFFIACSTGAGKGRTAARNELEQPTGGMLTGVVPCSRSPGFWPFATDGAVSLTYDDALKSPVRHALPALDAHGFKATFFLTTGKRWEPALWKPLARNGHELASHSVTHNSTLTRAAMEQEVVTSLASIAALEATQPHFSFAYPNGQPNGADGSYEPVVLRHALAARGLNGASLALGTPVDYGNIPARILGASDDLVAIIHETLERHQWTVFVVHGIEDDLYLNIPKKKHDELVALLARKNVWVAPFITVADYLKRCQARVSEVAGDAPG